MKHLILLATIAFLISGCASKIEYVDRPHEVLIPTKCEVPMPMRPAQARDFEGLKSLAVYTESLECALKLCRGEKCDKIK